MSAIHNAFGRARLGKNLDLAAKVSAAFYRFKPRLSRDQQRGWSTKISFRTYNSLKNQGVLD
ncbi:MULTISPECIES: hypothetical protein [Burkholderia]|uniref:hypothetical protein n=1 Tax=Burkholderia TaxID=32008 RepID=UPI000B79F410|nr:MULTISPECIES: hypothetical protein [Burkholderia]MBY4725723.1 hypothetical protein [Burkholderia contaminans]MCI3969261.1 hypothetical protein [Burkholderia sp. HI4860]OXI98495.1 hypothetical protein CFB48_24155 [Burkholderia sp. AU33647]